MEKSYKYLGYFVLLLIPLTLAGFYKTYIGQFPNFGDKIDLFIHVHAIIVALSLVFLGPAVGRIGPILVRAFNSECAIWNNL